MIPAATAGDKPVRRGRRVRACTAREKTLASPWPTGIVPVGSGAMPKTPFDRLVPRPATNIIHVVVETPRGSRNKYKYDEKLGLFRLNRVLFAGASFPYDFGYVPGTLGGDGDPLDVLLLMDDPAFPGCVVRARPIGVLRAMKEGNENHRIIAVSSDAKTWANHRDLSDLPRRMLREVEQFFHSIQNVDGREHALNGWRGVAEAERVIDRAIEAHANTLRPVKRGKKRGAVKGGKKR
jgi:inorganic pyrophosphatase